MMTQFLRLKLWTLEQQGTAVGQQRMCRFVLPMGLETSTSAQSRSIPLIQIRDAWWHMSHTDLQRGTSIVSTAFRLDQNLVWRTRQTRDETDEWSRAVPLYIQEAQRERIARWTVDAWTPWRWGWARPDTARHPIPKDQTWTRPTWPMTHCWPWRYAYVTSICGNWSARYVTHLNSLPTSWSMLWGMGAQWTLNSQRRVRQRRRKTNAKSLKMSLYWEKER